MAKQNRQVQAEGYGRAAHALSPVLFLIYSEMMMIDAMKEIPEGIKIGGKLVKDIRFADEQGMIAATERGLQRLQNCIFFGKSFFVIHQ